MRVVLVDDAGDERPALGGVGEELGAPAEGAPPDLAPARPALGHQVYARIPPQVTPPTLAETS